jgi:hypothetical protein
MAWPSLNQANEAVNIDVPLLDRDRTTRVCVGSRIWDCSKGEPELVEKDIRSSGSGDLQPGKKEVLTISLPSFTSLLQNNLLKETVFFTFTIRQKTRE